MQLFYIYLLFTIHRNFIYLIIIILFIINITCKKSIFECCTNFQMLNLSFCVNLNLNCPFIVRYGGPMRQRGPGQPCAMSLHLVRYIYFICMCICIFKALCLLLWIRICHHNEIYALVHVSTLFLKLLKNHRVWYPCQTLLFRGRQLNLNFSFASVIPLSCYNYDRDWGLAKIAMWNSFCKIKTDTWWES